MTDDPTQAPGTVTLMGSGETSPSMAKVHQAVMDRIEGDVLPVFLDTPAGFELNADQISTKAIEYFQKQFNLALMVATFKTATVSRELIDAALRKLRWANYVFAGPGSPSYATRTWRGTEVFEAMAHRLATGANLVFASAASISMARYTLPVYEIYKVGEEPHWIDGLDLLGPYGFELAIVPHWNNNDGGDSHDTRFCYMGQPRLAFLQDRLPASATILGIDEYTACILDLNSRQGTVIGAAKIVIRRRGREDRVYPAGTSFSLNELQAAAGAVSGGVPAEAAYTVESVDWPEPPQDLTGAAGPFIDLLVETRDRLRQAEEWALADRIRDSLADLGIQVEDGETTTWRKK